MKNQPQPFATQMIKGTLGFAVITGIGAVIIIKLGLPFFIVALGILFIFTKNKKAK